VRWINKLFLIACCLVNVRAKNYKYRTIPVRVIAKNVGDRLLRHYVVKRRRKRQRAKIEPVSVRRMQRYYLLTMWVVARAISISTPCFSHAHHQNLRLDLQNISRQSYDYITIMPKLRSTYDKRLIY